MAAAGWWPLVVLMDMTVKKSPDWFTVDLKPCQLKPKRQKKWQLWRPHCRSQRRLWFIVPSASRCEDNFPLIWLKWKGPQRAQHGFWKCAETFFFRIYVPFPLQKVCTIDPHAPTPAAPVGERGLKEEFRRPQSPGLPNLGVWGSAPPFLPGSNASKGTRGPRGWGWSVDQWGPWRRTPKMGHPIPAESSPNHHSLEVQPPWSLDSNKSFYAGQHIFSQFPMKRPVGFDGAWKVLRPPPAPRPGPLEPWPSGQHFLAGGFGPPRSNLVSEAGLSSVSGCWFYLSSVSWICENSFSSRLSTVDSCSKKKFTFFFNFFFKGKKEKRMEVGEGTGKGAERGRKKEQCWQLPWSRGCPQGAGSTFGTCSCQAGVSIFYLFFPLFKISIDVMF